MIIFAIIGVLTWRTTSLNALPDIGEPFDRREFGRVDVPNDRNAWKFYEKALAKHIDLKENEKPLQSGTDWAKSHPLIRAWVNKNREALALWVEASKRPDMLMYQPADFSFDFNLKPLQDMRDFARLGNLERSRRQLAGDIDGAGK